MSLRRTNISWIKEHKSISILHELQSVRRAMPIQNLSVWGALFFVNYGQIHHLCRGDKLGDLGTNIIQYEHKGVFELWEGIC
ncbi:hypothetical protein PAEVO_15160 [Paenibacillus sp. GM2FR]|nr:hypothetical protein PAEVO_15160 [Paenibacillus sp. GM2FR]